MATIKKGALVPSPQRAVHLRDWKRFFWRKHRQAEKRVIKQEVEK